MTARVLVTGGAGFLGSHLVDALLARGYEPVVLDDFSSGRPRNVPAGVECWRADVKEPWPLIAPAAYVLHLASPASPVDYGRRPMQTLLTNGEGTRRALDYARACGARLLLASTSEVYGDPEVHPQVETYNGNVSPDGPRSCYDEGKRYAEALASIHREQGTSVTVARIFNTYGPRMRRDDGRVVSTFLDLALRGEALTVHGTGSQTRSLAYVADTADALLRLLFSEHDGPVNVGSEEEVTVLALARTILRLVGRSEDAVRFVERLEDDPGRRRPDTSRARALLGWQATTPLDEGLRLTLDHVRTGARR